MTLTYDDYLAHYGVKGMKWGVRKERRNEGYSENQRARDKELYGKRGVKRINSNLNKGYSISTARSMEKTRRDEVQSRAANIRGRGGVERSQKQLIGGAVGAAAGAAAANKALQSIDKAITTRTGQKLLTAALGDPYAAAKATADIRGLMNDPESRKVLLLGGSAVGSITGSRALRTASNAYVRSKGYNPNRLN